MFWGRLWFHMWGWGLWEQPQDGPCSVMDLKRCLTMQTVCGAGGRLHPQWCPHPNPLKSASSLELLSVKETIVENELVNLHWLPMCEWTVRLNWTLSGLHGEVPSRYHPGRLGLGWLNLSNHIISGIRTCTQRKGSMWCVVLKERSLHVLNITNNHQSAPPQRPQRHVGSDLLQLK